MTRVRAAREAYGRASDRLMGYALKLPPVAWIVADLIAMVLWFAWP